MIYTDAEECRTDNEIVFRTMSVIRRYRRVKILKTNYYKMLNRPCNIVRK